MSYADTPSNMTKNLIMVVISFQYSFISMGVDNPFNLGRLHYWFLIGYVDYLPFIKKLWRSTTLTSHILSRMFFDYGVQFTDRCSKNIVYLIFP